MSGPVKVDVLVVGSGAAGLSAAVTAAVHGASVMVAEKASVLGGTSAWSGGWLWIPRNPLARAEGIDEAADEEYYVVIFQIECLPTQCRT